MQHGILMERHPGRTHIALIEGGHPTEIFSEPDDAQGALGNIFMGRVVRVLPGMQAAFVDIALGRSAFLYVADLLPTAATGTRAEDLPPIDSLIRPGAPLVVQVRKEALGDKGARVTTHITLTGRLVVLMPNATHVAISQRITDAERKDALFELLAPLAQQYGGLVVRTAALEASDDAIVAEVARLAQRWRALEGQANASSKPRVLWTEPTAALRAVRELYQPQMQGVAVNDAALVDALTQEVAAIAPHRAHTVRLWSEAPKGMAGLVEGNLWRSHKVHKARTRALARRVPLHGGGFLLIEPSETLTVIDVNSGTFVGQKTLEKTMVALNVAAAQAIAANLRLRNIGGIVVIDFVDLNTARGKATVMAALQEAMGADRAKHLILPMNKFGLVALTRRRLRSSLRQSATEPCPYCRGEGVVVTAQEMGEAILAALYAAVAKGPSCAFLVNAHPDVVTALQGLEGQALKNLESSMGAQVLMVARQNMHRARFEVLSLEEPGAIEAVDLRL